MNKIRVIHIIPMLSPGGAERVAVHIVSGLNRQRFEPLVISLGDRANCELDHLLDQAGVEVRYLGKRPGFDCRVYHRLDSVLRKCRPDVIHTHLQVLRYALPTMLLLRQVSFVHTVHNLAEREIESQARLIHRCAFHHGVVPIAVADEVAISVQRLYGIPRCQVISNGIPTGIYARPRTQRDEWRAKEGFQPNDILYVCVARFAPQKNHALLLKAFAQGPASDRHAHLVLVGEGALRAKLEMEARSLGLTGQVHFLGLRSDVPDVLGAMDVFALSSDYEGNPLSILEAMASGLPIVSTAVGGVPQLLESGREGLLIQPGDLEGLTETLNTLLRNPLVRKSLGMAAASRAKQNFDVSAMVREYEELYEHLVARFRSRVLRPTFAEPQNLTEQELTSQNR